MNNKNSDNKKVEFTNYVIGNLNQNEDEEKIKACSRVINDIDKFYGDYDNCFLILKSIINAKNNHASVLAADFAIQFATYYEDEELSNSDRSSLNTRIAEGVNCITNCDNWYKTDLINKVVNSDNKRNLGEVCLYLLFISKLENTKQADALSEIFNCDKIFSNKLDSYAAHLVWNTSENDLIELNEVLQSSVSVNDDIFVKNIKKMSGKKSKSRIRA